MTRLKLEYFAPIEDVQRGSGVQDFWILGVDRQDSFQNPDWILDKLRTSDSDKRGLSCGRTLMMVKWMMQ